MKKLRNLINPLIVSKIYTMHSDNSIGRLQEKYWFVQIESVNYVEMYRGYKVFSVSYRVFKSFGLFKRKKYMVLDDDGKVSFKYSIKGLSKISSIGLDGKTFLYGNK